MVDLVGDDEQVKDEEQAMMDNHEDKVAEIIERLQVLRPKAKTALSVAHSTDPSHHLCRRINDVESNLCLVKEEVDPLRPGPSLDRCLLLQLEEQVGNIRTDLSNVIRDILSCQSGDEDLLDKKERLRKSCSR